MPIIKVQGVDIDFPREPYKCQIDYMDRAMQTLLRGQNALLESPTGTGKTLCLLCSTLAWQSSLKGRQLKLAYSSQPIVNNQVSESSLPVKAEGTGAQAAVQTAAVTRKPQCTIIYASRTHSQLQQVIGELRSTSYKPKVTVMGSRMQLCIHDRISNSKKGPAALNHACNVATSQHSCSYRNNLDKYDCSGDRVAPTSAAIFDIEDLRALGARDKVCPYFYTKEFSRNADLVLLPYNYLLDSSIRLTLKVEWQNAVIIFDEAHNLEKVAADAASFSLSSADVAACILELQRVLLHLKDNAALEAAMESVKSNNGDSHQFNKKTGDSKETRVHAKFSSDSSGKDDGGGSGKEQPTLTGIARVLRALFEFEKCLEAVPLSRNGPTCIGDTASYVLPGEWLCTTLDACGFSNAMAYKDVEEIQRAANWLMDDVSNAMEGTSASFAEPKLVALASALQRVFRGATLTQSKNVAMDYKVFVCEEESSSFGGRSSASSSNISGSVGGGGKKRVLNYWAFSPGIAMQELKSLGVRSVILTSGTLSPLDSFKEDMKIPFQIQLQNPHVINASQMWVGALSMGPSGKKLLSSYNSRDTEEYKDELGLSILQICQTMLGRGGRGGTPDGEEISGGVLVFFTGYGVMGKTIDHWKKTGMWEKLAVAGGSVVVEPQGSGRGANSDSGRGKSGISKANANKWNPQKHSSDQETSSKPGQGQQISFVSGRRKTPNNPEKAINFEDDDDEGGGEKSDRGVLSGVVSEFEEALRTFRRCILIAVCRGKVSEGIDFSNHKGRAVIITGIPYSPPMDPWTVLKKQYLDEKIARDRAPAASALSNGQSGYQNKILVASTGVAGSVAQLVPELGSGLIHSGVSNYAAAASGYGLMGAQLQHHSSAGPTHRPIYPPYPPPPAAAPVPVGAGAKNIPNQFSSAHRLSGQAWYTQMASRAVNQAIGRIIRHRNDWGGVFLLDERFQNEKQKSELSSWLRGYVKKYDAMAPALQSFRDFISNAQRCEKEMLAAASQSKILEGAKAKTIHDAQNPKAPPQLHFATVTADASLYSDPPSLSSKSAAAPRHRDEFQRHVIVREDQLENGSSSDGGVNELSRAHPTAANSFHEDALSNVGQTFIDPRLLMSQPVLDFSPPSPTALTINPKPAPQRASNDASTAPTIEERSRSIIEVLNKPSNLSTISYSACVSSNQHDSVQQNISRSVSVTAYSSELLADVIPQPRVAVAENKHSGGLAAMDRRIEEKRQSNISRSLSTPAAPSSNILSSSFSQSQSGVNKWLSMKTESKSFSESAKAFAANKARLQANAKNGTKKFVTPSHFSNIANAREASAVTISAALNNLSQTNQPPAVKVPMSIVAGNSTVSTLSQPSTMFSKLSKLIHHGDNRGDEQISTQTLGQKRKSDPSLSDFHTSGASQKSRFQPSARAQLLLRASNPSPASAPAPALISSAQYQASSSSKNSEPVVSEVKSKSLGSVKPGVLARLRGVDFNMSAPSARGVAVENNNSSNSLGGLTKKGLAQLTNSSSKLCCGICKEQAVDPGAGRCGHVCCLSCWSRWLAIKQACPVCKLPTTKENVAKLLIQVVPSGDAK